MGRVFIDESTLTAIGDAIRNKTGGEDLISPGNFAYEITNLPSGGGEAPEPIKLSGVCSNMCIGQVCGAYIDMFGDTISTENITAAGYMFKDNTASHIPFTINFKSTTDATITNIFRDCKNLMELPVINGLKPSSISYFMSGCHMIREIPEDYTATWDWSYINELTSSYTGEQHSMFEQCRSLRKAPMVFFENYNTKVTYSYNMYNYAFASCYSLDEIVDLPVFTGNLDSNVLGSTFVSCFRLKRLTFATDNGTPYTANWKNQFIDLQTIGNAGTTANGKLITKYNSGITEDKLANTSSTYYTLKNDDDWYTDSPSYSRYNHDSAVETLRSLPDTSAYGTNTIRFLGVAGRDTDGGAINTLTEEEIAVAAVKGWTVTFA